MNNKKESTTKTLLKTGAWFFLLNSVFGAIISINYLKGMGVVDFGTIFYLAITALSHFSMLFFIPYLVIFLPLVFLFSKKSFSSIISAFIGTILITILFLDSFVFGIYRFHAYNKFILEMLIGAGASEIFDFSLFQIILFSVVFVIVFFIEYFLYQFLYRLVQRERLNYGRYVVVFLLVCLLASNLIHAYAYTKGERQITKISLLYPLHFPLRANSLSYKLGIIGKDDNAFIKNTQENSLLQYPLSPMTFSDSVSNKNILLILIDSWNVRAFDSINMPNIYKFSKKTVQFTNHYSGDNGTRTGVFSLFYSIPGLYFDAVNFAPGTTPVLMDVLDKKRYEMGVFASANLTNPPFNRIIFSKVKSLQVETPGEISLERDKNITKRWLNFTENYVNENKKQPFFGFVFYDLLHGLTLPDEQDRINPTTWENARYELLNNDLDPTEYFNLYKNCAHFVDRQVKRILDDLQQKGLLENTIVIITGDHSQEYNENKKNFWGHNSNYTKYQLQVPFLLYDKNRKPETFHHWTAHYDVVPTLMCDYFNCTTPEKNYSSGKNLFDTTERTWLLVGHRKNLEW